MNAEDRLKQILSESALDPGPKQDWDGFIQTAHRVRLVHRAVLAGAVAAAGLVVVLGGAALNGVFDRSAPQPADDKKQQEQELEEELEEVEERVQDTEELAEDARIVPGPRDAKPGQEAEGVLDDPEDPGSDDDTTRGHSSAAKATCRGVKATIVGTSRDDVLIGTPGPDVIAALGGDDTIRAGDGSDHICAGPGADHLYGGTGDDSLVGEQGNDYLDGGDHFDFVHFPTAPLDVNVNFEHGFVAGDGDDEVVHVEGAEGTEYGDNLVGHSASNLFVGREGDDALNGNGGDDIFLPGPGDDGMVGHGGRDTVDFGSSRSGIRLDLGQHAATGGKVATGDGSDRLYAIENIKGTDYDDTISGNGRANILLGGRGNDSLSGAEGDDVLLGGAMADQLDGGGGADALDGGSGEDTCTTGEKKQSCERSGPLGAGLFFGLWAAIAWLGRRATQRGAPA